MPFVWKRLGIQTQSVQLWWKDAGKEQRSYREKETDGERERGRLGEGERRERHKERGGRRKGRRRRRRRRKGRKARMAEGRWGGAEE